MDYRTLNKIFAATVFVVAIFTYWMTLQPSVPFWDCGEFSAAAMWQQVPHPPGAPLWLIVAKAFEVFLPGDPGHNFNLFAALCSAFAAMFAYLIAVNAIERFRPYHRSKPASAYISTYGAGLIGALAFLWSDSNWFNSVESEVYSAATLLATLAMWMMMKWDQQADQPGHERWLLLIAYVLGLAIGVHLLALLVIPSVALTIYGRRYKKITPVGVGTTIGVTGLFFIILYNSTLTWIPKILSASAIGGILLLLLLLGITGWAYTQKKAIIFLTAASFSLVILGYTTYAQILVRSASHPVMNENEPDTFSELARYLGREQYGSRSAWPRRHDHIRGGYYKSRLIQYGPLPVPIGNNPDGSIRWENIDAGSEINYMLNYQIGHMYLRYFGWNFIGRVSDMQTAGISWSGSANKQEKAELIRPSGGEDIFPVTFYGLPFLLGLIGIVVHFRRDWKMATIFMTAFLLWGVIMALQQNQQEPQPRERDYFYTASFMVFSVWVGLGAFGLAKAFGRKKAGSNVGKEGGDTGGSAPQNIGLTAAVLGGCLLIAPINMAVNGWNLHDRSGNWLAWDYAYNLLQSCDANAILFTNGDNDTFPIWYVQDVAGIRRDVRVVNLELAQTPWYITQMKLEPSWNAPPVPMTFHVEQIKDKGNGRNDVNPTRGGPRIVKLPVPADVMAWATNGKVRTAGEMEWKYEPKEGDLFTPKNQIVRSIVEQTAKEGWKRPIYFSLTTGNEWAGLYPFLRQEGMAQRVMPVAQSGSPIDVDIMRKCLIETLPDDEYYTDQHYGFKFRGLNDPGVYFFGQDDHRRPINFYYHQIYIQFAQQLLYLDNDREGAIAVLDKMVETIPPTKFGPPVPYLPYLEDYGFLTKIAEIYRDAGATEKAREWAQKALDEADAIVQSGAIPRYDSRNSQDYTVDQVRARTATILGNYREASQIYEQMLARNPNNQSAKVERDGIRIEQALASGDSATAQKLFDEALASYGAAGDQRALLLGRRFPSLVEGVDAANQEVTASTSETGNE